jgi:antitoxin CcdA
MLLFHPNFSTGWVVRTKVNLSLDETVTREARTLGVNMSRVAEAARLEHNRRWREENQAALEAFAREIEVGGLPLARFGSFRFRGAVRYPSARGRHAHRRFLNAPARIGPAARGSDPEPVRNPRKWQAGFQPLSSLNPARETDAFSAA